MSDYSDLTEWSLPRVKTEGEEQCECCGHVRALHTSSSGPCTYCRRECKVFVAAPPAPKYGRPLRF